MAHATKPSTRPRIRTSEQTSLSSNFSRSPDSTVPRVSSSVDVKNLPNISTTVFDCCCFLFYCGKHKQILLTKGNMKFFPHAQLHPGKPWHDYSKETAVQLLCEEQIALVDPFARFTLMHLFRLQLPQSQRFITRLVYLVELKPDSKEIPCCQNTRALRWFSRDDCASSNIPNLWGPEVSFFASALKKADKKVENPQVEYSLEDAYKYILADGAADEKPLSAMMANLNVSDTERVFADFVEHTFPSFFLTRDSFTAYMVRHQIETRPKIINRFYCTFRLRNKKYLQFTELVLGLASIDQRTVHADGRVKYVFRYYDRDKDWYLNFGEFRLLMRDINAKVTDREVLEEMAKIGVESVNKQEMISFRAFKKAVGAHTFRGTSHLCRSKVSPFTQITRSLAARKLGKVFDGKLKKILANSRYPGRCIQCVRQQPFELANHIVTLNAAGRFTKSRLLNRTPTDRYSVEMSFGTKSILHFLQQEVRNFNGHKGTAKNFKGLYADMAKEPQKLQGFFRDVTTICTDMARIVEREDRVLKIVDPCYVIGDIHGNLEDLMTLESLLFKSTPLLTANYLFLGDYVDRGKWGFECFLYLMILKLRSPNKVYLLRGNHEVRIIQMKYTFHKELVKKYGDKMGHGFFDLYNHVFDRLPFCAVINQSIFGCHGGIPCSVVDLDQLNRTTPHVVSSPEEEAIALWEIIWSDPLEFARFEETAALQGLQLSTSDASYMYLPNNRRGTSYLFSEYALYTFFNHNYLQFMVRAHEVPLEGFKFTFGRLCTTVFSCSHYCKNNNESAILLIGRESRLRVIRIDTSNNVSAMADS